MYSTHIVFCNLKLFGCKHYLYVCCSYNIKDVYPATTVNCLAGRCTWLVQVLCQPRKTFTGMYTINTYNRIYILLQDLPNRPLQTFSNHILTLIMLYKYTGLELVGSYTIQQVKIFFFFNQNFFWSGILHFNQEISLKHEQSSSIKVLSKFSFSKKEKKQVPQIFLIKLGTFKRKQKNKNMYIKKCPLKAIKCKTTKSD